MRYVVASFLLATAAVATACGGGNPTAPSVPAAQQQAQAPPVPSTPTVSLSELSSDARNYVVNGTMSASMIQRLRDRSSSDPVRVFIGPYSEAQVAQATSFWEARLPIRFRPVTVESEGEISLARDLPETSATACGGAVVVGGPLPAIAGGKIKIAIGIRAGCSDQGTTLISVIAHEIGHILGFGHTSDFTDVMSPATWGLIASPSLEEAGKWIYGAPVGAKVVP